MKLCPICGSTEEDESCQKVHLMRMHKANDAEQLLRALRNSELDVPKLGRIPKIMANSKEATKGKKPGATSGVKSRIAHEGVIRSTPSEAFVEPELTETDSDDRKSDMRLKLKSFPVVRNLQ